MRTTVELFKQHKDKIGCVLSDLSMPHINGWDRLAALRQSVPDIPVILSSGYNKTQVLSYEHSGQIHSFLAKPYQLAGLKDALAKALARNYET